MDILVTYFLLFLLDDAFSLHERAGDLLHDASIMSDQITVQSESYGELVYVFSLGIVLIILFLSIILIKGGIKFKRHSINIAALIAILLFFGIGIDFAHYLVLYNKTLSFILSSVEDGGEMIAASYILWYSYRTLKDKETLPRLFLGFFNKFI